MGIEKRRYKSGRITYYARLRSDGQKFRSRACPSRELAEVELGKMREAWRNGSLERKYGSTERSRRTFSDAAELYLKARELEAKVGERSASTHQRERTTVKRLEEHFGARTLLTQLGSGEINGWAFERRKQGVKGATINRELSALRGILDEAQRHGWLDHNPALSVSRCKEATPDWRWLTPKEAKRLVDACGKAPGQGRHLQPLVITALFTGMRRGELLSLRWENVHLARAEIEVVASKNRSRRTVPLRSEVVKALRAWRRHSKGDFVFARGSGQPFSRIQRGFQSAVEKAKLGSLRFHDLRHTAASWMAQEGADVYEIARVLGHRDIASTMRYAHLIPRSSRRAVDRMPAALDESKVVEFQGEKPG